jgi:hypothetical protein
MSLAPNHHFFPPSNDKKIDVILTAGKTPPGGGVYACWFDMYKKWGLFINRRNAQCTLS